MGERPHLLVPSRQCRDASLRPGLGPWNLGWVHVCTHWLLCPLDGVDIDVTCFLILRREKGVEISRLDSDVWVGPQKGRLRSWLLCSRRRSECRGGCLSLWVQIEVHTGGPC